MVNIDIKMDRIGMPVESEAAFVHLCNCLPKLISTCGILSVETELEFKVKNQYYYISALRLK